jgi:hypothetical protein
MVRLLGKVNWPFSREYSALMIRCLVTPKRNLEIIYLALMIIASIS